MQASPNWPEWTTPQREIDVLRAAIHAMARAVVEERELPDHVYREEQAIVDHYISQARMRDDL